MARGKRKRRGPPVRQVVTDEAARMPRPGEEITPYRNQATRDFRAQKAAGLLAAMLAVCPVLHVRPGDELRPVVIEDPSTTLCPVCGQLVQGAAARGCPKMLSGHQAFHLALPPELLTADASDVF